jgi:hypothetical protein
MPTSREHKKPNVPHEAQEAERVAKHMYTSLTQAEAPKATPTGYIMGACTVLKLLLQQAAAQGANKDELKQWSLNFIQGI